MGHILQHGSCEHGNIWSLKFTRLWRFGSISAVFWRRVVLWLDIIISEDPTASILRNTARRCSPKDIDFRRRWTSCCYGRLPVWCVCVAVCRICAFHTPSSRVKFERALWIHTHTLCIPTHISQGFQLWMLPLSTYWVYPKVSGLGR